MDRRNLYDCGMWDEDQAPARLMAYRAPNAFARLIDILVTASVSYLVCSCGGADLVQVFDTWAGILPPRELQRWCIEPAAPDR